MGEREWVHKFEVIFHGLFLNLFKRRIFGGHLEVKARLFNGDLAHILNIIGLRNNLNVLILWTFKFYKNTDQYFPL